MKTIGRGGDGSATRSFSRHMNYAKHPIFPVLKGLIR